MVLVLCKATNLGGLKVTWFSPPFLWKGQTIPPKVINIILFLKNLKIIIREMETKTTLRCHLTPVRMARLSKTGELRCRSGVRKGWSKGILRPWWDCELVQPLWKTAQRFFEKLKIESPCHLAVPLLGINPKEMESEPWRAALHVHCSIIHNNQDVETISCVHQQQQMDREDVVCVYSRILFNYRKEGNPAIRDNMDGPWGH